MAATSGVSASPKSVIWSGLAVPLGEFSTAVRYRIPLKVLVIKNNMLNQIAWEKMLFLGNPQFGIELPSALARDRARARDRAQARLALEMHPDAGGFRLAPGAHASLELDIMSVAPGLVGAETFAAVHPANNRKLKLDLAKLSTRPERHKYVFFLVAAVPPDRAPYPVRAVGGRGMVP